MPELPEVETICNGLRPHLCNKTITGAVVRNDKLRLPVTKNIIKLTKNLQISSVQRRAKYIIIALNHPASKDNSYLLLHLGMTGSLQYLPSNTPVKKHDHIDFILGDFCLRFADPRRFGCVLWLKDDPLQHPLLSNSGPEPLTEDFNAGYLFALKRKKNIKSLIMDNSIVVGVGNIYAAEALYLSGIHPNKMSNLISIWQYEILVKNIKTILAKAITHGGTTFRNYVDSEGKPGKFVQNLQVYGRKGLPCYACNTLIEAIILGQRTSTFCPQCQT